MTKGLKEFKITYYNKNYFNEIANTKNNQTNIE